MKNHEFFEPAVIMRIRHALQTMQEQDKAVEEYIKTEIIGRETWSAMDGQKKKAVFEDYMHVKERYYYVGMLDSLWETIMEVQQKVEVLNTYTPQVIMAEEEPDTENMSMETVELSEVAVEENEEPADEALITEEIDEAVVGEDETGSIDSQASGEVKPEANLLIGGLDLLQQGATGLVLAKKAYKKAKKEEKKKAKKAKKKAKKEKKALKKAEKKKALGDTLFTDDVTDSALDNSKKRQAKEKITDSKCICKKKKDRCTCKRSNKKDKGV